MKPFSDIPKRCPKCESEDIQRLFTPARPEGLSLQGSAPKLITAKSEHLVVRCNHCGYGISGEFACADAAGVE